MLAVVAGAIFAGVAVVGDGVDAGDVAGPGGAAAAWPGRLVCVGGICGFGPKNLAHRMIARNATSAALTPALALTCVGTVSRDESGEVPNATSQECITRSSAHAANRRSAPEIPRAPPNSSGE